MQLFVGLGNPGARYANHRHNIGFMALDAIAEAHGFAPWRRKFQADYRVVKAGSGAAGLELLERLNGPTSSLESNDCAFSPPHASDIAQPGKSLQCEGRLMILCRELELNLSLPRVEGVSA